jgi:uncharacterized protein (TIGR02231 family)
MSDFIAPITAVTVYNDRALVTRKGTQRLEAGEHELHVNGLPQFLRDSLRATGRGPQGTRILSVDVSNEYHARAADEEIERLQSELDTLKQHQSLLESQQTALKDRRQWLRSLGEQSKDFARGIAQGQMKAQDCADFFQFMTTQATQDAEAALRLENTIIKARAETQAKERELYRRQGGASSDRLSATIVVALAEAGELELEISYILYGASWHPSYDIRVLKESDKQKTARGHIELTYLGIVEQQTSEDWKAVSLALSTARPSKAAVLPDLQPWYIHVAAPPMPRAARSYMAQPQATGEMFAVPMGAPIAPAAAAPLTSATIPLPPPAMPVEVSTATTEYSGTAVVFRAGRSIDIPSDNTPHKTTIAHDELPCDFDYVSAPAIEEQVHVRGTITNTSERVLLSGQANIFMEGEYIGSTQIKQTASNEQFDVFLGIDDSIKVERKLLEHSVDKGGSLLQSDIRRSTYTYRITVHNYSEQIKKIVVRDHLPISQHERIKIKTLSISPQPTERTKLEQLTWEFTLAPAKEQNIEYRFTIEHPNDINVIGMP